MNCPDCKAKETQRIPFETHDYCDGISWKGEQITFECGNCIGVRKAIDPYTGEPLREEDFIRYCPNKKIHCLRCGAYTKSIKCLACGFDLDRGD